MGHVAFDREKLKEMIVNSPLPKGAAWLNADRFAEDQDPNFTIYPPPYMREMGVHIVKLAFSLGNRAHFGSEMGLFSGLFALRFQ